MTFGGNLRCWRKGCSKLIISGKISIHPSIPYHYQLQKRFYIGYIDVGFVIVTALNMSAMLRNVSLLYTKDHLYITTQKSNFVILRRTLQPNILPSKKNSTQNLKQPSAIEAFPLTRRSISHTPSSIHIHVLFGFNIYIKVEFIQSVLHCGPE